MGRIGWRHTLFRPRRLPRGKDLGDLIDTDPFGVRRLHLVGCLDEDLGRVTV